MTFSLRKNKAQGDISYGMNLRGTKVLLVGLGVLGGGEAIARFLKKEGAHLTITDTKNKSLLAPTLKKIVVRGVTLVCGRHRKEDFKNNEFIVYNPSVSISSPWVSLARKYKRKIENDLSLFLSVIQDRKKDAHYLAVTGTRGKTTTTTWLGHFLEGAVVGGNMPTKGLLGLLNKKGEPFVLELSSFQLEFIRKGLPAPKVAVLTNMYVDHLNRHGTFNEYLKTKANIFLNQTDSDFLVLNADNKASCGFLRYKPKAAIYYTSLKKLPRTKNGLCVVKNDLVFQDGGRIQKICSLPELPDHQKANLLSALLAAYLYTGSWKPLVKKIKTLPTISFRQEIIHSSKNLTIINDTAGTSPDAVEAALERFSKEKQPLTLITGGTDKELDFKDLARKIKKHILPPQLFLLEGSATNKLLKELQKNHFFTKHTPQLYTSLQAIFKDLFSQKKPSGTLLFSPGSASFEKFKNEFDRGRIFNRLVREHIWKE